jgi:DNA-binding transcriptional MerR regulator
LLVTVDGSVSERIPPMLARPVDANRPEAHVSDSPAAARPTQPNHRPPAGRWLSLGPASRMVGVDPDTLRRWADEGRVEVFVTPGHHRRFDRRAMERLAANGRGEAQPLASLGASPERLARAYRRSYASDVPARPVTADDGDDRERYRQDGRRLVEALVAHLDAERADEAARDAAEAEAVTLVDEMARRLHASGRSLTEAVALFVTARRPFLAELAGLGRRRTLDAARLGQLYEDATGLLDRLLLRLVDSYQEAGG